ncbi:hypothetical protein B296_00020323 [Ensete ventricosum]|uniref:Uncharacterized protein n=1 Tax=Ensete ventricosum TaxID=4639 RepID=A0A426ZPQ8_ENSVE|nr:hypothetical protein B296_00020323 [Ensete ventricosum]
MPAGSASTSRRHPSGLSPLVGAAGLPCRLALGRDLAVGSWPSLAAPPPHCLHYKNTTRTHRTILRDLISSYAV